MLNILIWIYCLTVIPVKNAISWLYDANVIAFSQILSSKKVIKVCSACHTFFLIAMIGIITVAICNGD